MLTAYSLDHLSKTIPDGEYTHDFFEINIGYFSTKEKALQAIEHYKTLPGFKNQSKVHQKSRIDTGDKAGFYIYGVRIDEPDEMCGWQGGFITDYYEEDEESGPGITPVILPCWLKKHNLANYTLKDIDQLFTKKYGKNNYPTGPGSEYFIVRLFFMERDA